MTTTDPAPLPITTPSLESVVHVLGSDALHPFENWPDDAPPHGAVGLYTIWQGESFLYVGISGKCADTLETTPKAKGRHGLKGRLRSHWQGQRGGDQFAVYVADRIVLPNLTTRQIASIATGDSKFDSHTRWFIRNYLGFRYFVYPQQTPAAIAEIQRLERVIRHGHTPLGVPFLNRLHASVISVELAAPVRAA